MMFWRSSGLLHWSVIDEAERILKEAKFKVGDVAEVGPGLISTSPAKSKRQKISKLEVRRWIRKSCGIRELGLKRNANGTWSKVWQTEAKGMGGKSERRGAE
jgi:hypothetical protein